MKTYDEYMNSVSTEVKEEAKKLLEEACPSLNNLTSVMSYSTNPNDIDLVKVVEIYV